MVRIVYDLALTELTIEKLEDLDAEQSEFSLYVEIQAVREAWLEAQKFGAPAEVNQRYARWLVGAEYAIRAHERGGGFN